MLGFGPGSMTAKAALWQAEIRRPRTGTTRGRYQLAILTLCGWSYSSDRFASLKLARESALWFSSLDGVERVQIIDTSGEASIVEDLTKHPRKPR